MSSNPPGEPSGGISMDKSKKLRRPHASTQERIKNGELDPSLDTMVKSTLSANAPEFVPKSVQLQQPSQDEALFEKFQQLVIRPSHLTAIATSSPTSALFKDAVFQLTSNPGPMVEFLKPILQSLYNENTDKVTVDEIIAILFEHSICESNFRFTGAKICKYMSEELKAHPKFSNFRSWFLNRCGVEYEKREELLKTNKDRLCGLAMYFGELFLILEIHKDGCIDRIGILRAAISDLLRTMLTQPDDTTVQCATQLLKLTGTAVMETTKLEGKFDDIFAVIKSLEKSPTLDKRSHCLINSVLSRLEYNFGVGQETSPSKPITLTQDTSKYYPNYQVNEPVFYNRQGQTTTREESGFCPDSGFEGLNSEEQEFLLQCEAENMGNPQQWLDQGQPWLDQGGDNLLQQQYGSDMSEYTQWSSNQDQIYGLEEGDFYGGYNPDMDDEMIAAYEMFLKESGQQGRR